MKAKKLNFGLYKNITCVRLFCYVDDYVATSTLLFYFFEATSCKIIIIIIIILNRSRQMKEAKEEHHFTCALSTIAAAMHKNMSNKLATTLITQAAAASSLGCATRKRSGRYRRGGAVPRLKKSVWGRLENYRYTKHNNQSADDDRSGDDGSDV